MIILCGLIFSLVFLVSEGGSIERGRWGLDIGLVLVRVLRR